MKIKTILTTTLALACSVALFTACSETDPKMPETGSKSVVLKLNAPVEELAPGTRAEGDKVGNSEIYLSDGHILFVSQSGQIMKHMTISNQATTDSNVKISDLKAGTRIENVSDNSRSVYIICNLPSTPTFPLSPVGMNIKDINKHYVEVNDINSTLGDVSAVPLYGKGNIDTNTDPAEVEVEVRAIGSRLEIVKFDLKAGAEITSYQIDGIFINAYYERMEIDGTVDATNYLKNNGSGDDLHQTYEGGSTAYPANFRLYDWNSAGLGTLSGKVYSPKGAASGKVWAYNVFPGSPAPHIVVRLSGVVLNGNYNMANPQYLTVRTYNNKGITSFVKGNAYKIETFLFDENDLTDKPELGVMDINVSVDLIKWTTQTVTADL